MSEKLPETNKCFNLKGDLSIFKIDENKIINVWMRAEKFWCNPYDLRQENAIYKKIEDGEWSYLFEHRDEEFSASNIEAAMCRFLDESWGHHYVKHLEELGFKAMEIDAIDDLEDLKEDGYYRLIQKLENGAIFKIEVWQKEDENFEGLAQVIEG